MHLGLKTEKLYEILDLIAYYFPECEGINMDATVTSILHKSQERAGNACQKKGKASVSWNRERTG